MSARSKRGYPKMPPWGFSYTVSPYAPGSEGDEPPSQEVQLCRCSEQEKPDARHAEATRRSSSSEIELGESGHGKVA